MLESLLKLYTIIIELFGVIGISILIQLIVYKTTKISIYNKILKLIKN